MTLADLTLDRGILLAADEGQLPLALRRWGWLVVVLNLVATRTGRVSFLTMLLHQPLPGNRYSLIMIRLFFPFLDFHQAHCNVRGQPELCLRVGPCRSLPTRCDANRGWRLLKRGGEKWN